MTRTGLRKTMKGTAFADAFMSERATLLQRPLDELLDPHDPHARAIDRCAFTTDDLVQQTHVRVARRGCIATTPKDRPFWTLPGDMLQTVDSFDRRFREIGLIGLRYRGLDEHGTPVFAADPYGKAPYRPDPFMAAPHPNEIPGIVTDYDLPHDVWRDLTLFDLTTGGRIYLPHLYHDARNVGRDLELRAVTRVIPFLTQGMMDAAADIRARLSRLDVAAPDAARAIVERWETALRVELADHELTLQRTRSHAPAGMLNAVPRWRLDPCFDRDDETDIQLICDLNRRFEDACWARVVLAADLGDDIDLTVQPSHPNTDRARRELHDALDTLYPGAGFDVTCIGVRRRDGRAMFLHTQGDELLPDEVNGRGLGGFNEGEQE